VPGGQATVGQQPPVDPADRVTLDDNVRLALLVVLQRLSPAERVVYVLHDIFQVPFESIAQTVGRAVPACRQLARRARLKISDAQRGAAFDVGADEHRQVTEKFIAASAGGDLDSLLEVLAPDAWGEFHGGPDQPRVPGVIRGAVRVARNLLRFWGPGATLVSYPVAGQPALLGFVDRRLAGVLIFTMRDGKIQAVDVIGDPRQLSFVSSQLG
jgi:RNA polymerase sigma-70 factor (ECF subfamily)